MDEQLNILIIDDSPDDRDLYLRLLKKVQETTIRCHEVSEGLKGVEAIGELGPDCVLLDYSLPGANGIEILQLIKAQHPMVPVIMLTGQGNEAIAVQAIKQGADDYLSKSFLTADTLLRSIRMAIEHSRLHRKIDEQEKLLLKNETRYQQLINGVSDHSFCWLDKEGNVESWCSGAEKMKGYTANEILGKPFSVFYAEEDVVQGAPHRALQKALAEGQCVEEGWRMRKDGSKFWASVHIDVLRDASGEPIGFVKVTRDITERRNSEIQRQQLMEKLMQSNTELERFAYVASHDMQEPVRMVINFSQMIARNYGAKFDEEGRKYLKFVTESADRIRSMIDDLLDYARLDSEKRGPVLIDGALELDHVLANLAGLIKESNAQITHDVLPPLKGNPVQFMRLLQNLVVNALKYQSPGNVPKVHIGLEDQGASWCITIADNGVGIDEAFVQKIFEPFRRLHSWEQVKGTGIGLALCKKIVENHGGKIWVTSVVGKGSTFFVTLPKLSQDQEQAA